MQDAATHAPVIEAVGLTRRYGDRLAVDNVSFGVRRGEIFGFLGPNGAGKSTTTRMLTGFINPSAGIARVAGYEIATDPVGARQHIGVVPEEANVYADLSVWQNVMLMAELHSVPRRERERRANELLDQFGLGDRHAQNGRTLSKGLRQRLMICAALVSAPEILFLDEPTSGLDVASAHLIREIVARLNRERGMTVFITTHNMEEAGDLCHRIAIIDKGRLVVVDTPQNLRGAVDSRRSVEVRFEGGPVTPAAVLEDEPGREVTLLPDGFRVFTPSPGQLAQQIATRATERGLRIASLRTMAPNLEDVFLHITRTGEAQRKASDNAATS